MIKLLSLKLSGMKNRDKAFVVRVIESCKTYHHVETSRKLIYNYCRKWTDSDYPFLSRKLFNQVNKISL